MRGSLVGIAATMAFLLATPGASASEEVGNSCAADGTAKNLTVLPLSSVGSPLPLTVPAPGVVTRWRMQVGPDPPAYLAQRLLVFRPGGGVGEFLAVAGSETEPVKTGENEFRTRIPVKSGDRFGLHGYSGTYVCTGAGTDSSGVFDGEARIGKSKRFRVEAGLGTPVTAIVEPDVDGDGFGDERQDRCPQSAAFHREACSPVKLRVRAKARKRSILVRARADIEISLQVFGQVGWGFKAKGKRKSGHPNPTRLIVGIAGSTKQLAPGALATFRMALPGAVKRRLGRITPRESLKAELTATATDADGAIAIRRLTVRLRGWERG